VDNRFYEQTPKTLKLTKNSHHLCLLKEGYQPNRQKLQSHFSPIVAGNLEFVPIGLGVGALSGIMLTHGRTSGWDGLGIVICATAGVALGACVALAGAIIDSASGGGKETCGQVHSNLNPSQ
jgi:hypothetical protein